MKSVSTAWKELNEQLFIDEPSFIEISYKKGDDEAQADATAMDNGSEAFADTAQTVDNLEKSYSKYATLELNSWALDGSVKVLPDTVTQDTGFVSSVLCGDDGIFTAHPVITIGFTTLHANLIPGVTIKWSEAFDECATDFTVTAYNGASVVATKNVTDNTKNLSFVEMDIASYDKIEIEIIEWCLPYRRARIEEIYLGVIAVFGKSDLMGYEHGQFADLLSTELPESKVVFSISNVNSVWNPDNPAGSIKYLLERQEVTVRYGFRIGGSIEWVKAGTFYMSEWDTPSNGITATFTASDLFEFMQTKFTTSSTTLTLYNLATEAFTLAGLPITSTGGNRWSIDNSLSSITVTLPEDFDYTCAEVVQLCANAACCVLYQDRDGIIRIEPLASVLTDYVISKTVSYKNAEFETKKELKSVDVNEGMGAATNSVTGEVQEIENPLIQNSAVANNAAAWVKDCLKNRNIISGTFRADPRLDVLDKVTVESKYATNTVFITNIEYSYNGAFKGSYEGRVI